jgi:hypothetical protein
MVAVLAVVAAALPIQSAFAPAPTLTLTVAPNPVAPGQAFFFSGNENPPAPGDSVAILVYRGSTCKGTVLFSYGTTEDGSGNYGTGDMAGPPYYPVGQYSAQSNNPSTLLQSSCDPFYVGSPPAVGGVVMPTDALAILSPWLAVIGVVGCIGTVAVLVKKRKTM